MKSIYKILIPLLLAIPLSAVADTAYKNVSTPGNIVEPLIQNQQLLADPFPVYSDGDIVINHPSPGFKKISIPVDNSYKQNPGCYIMCFSHKKGLYKVGTHYYTHGMIRVAGQYQGRVCQPTNAGANPISTMQSYKDLCITKVKTCDNDCWAGGDTGGWYGIQ